jgi:hypothetical protein
VPCSALSSVPEMDLSVSKPSQTIPPKFLPYFTAPVTSGGAWG